MIPDYQTLMKPVLKSSEKGEVKISEVVETLAKDLALTDEEQAELLPSGKQTTFANRVHWAKTYLLKAGLVEVTRRGYFVITQRGKEAILTGKIKIEAIFSIIKILRTYSFSLGRFPIVAVLGG